MGIKLPSEIRREREAKFTRLANSEQVYPVAHCDTSKGPVQVELRFDWGPVGAGRLLSLIVDGFFTNNVFYRVRLCTSCLVTLYETILPCYYCLNTTAQGRFLGTATATATTSTVFYKG